jgi:hypothetical protein
MLAYHLLVVIDKTLLDKGIHTSWATVRQALETLQVATIVLPTDGDIILRMREGSTPDPNTSSFAASWKYPNKSCDQERPSSQMLKCSD